MAVISLKGSRRDRTGKGGARKSRAAGQIPAVLYGKGKSPLAVSVERVEFETAIRQHRGANPILSLAVEGEEHTALLRSVQRDPLTQAFMHIDFQHISLTETVDVWVAVHLEGLPVGVKDGGGILEGIMREIEVRCLPAAIPPSIDVDVSALGVGDSIHVSSLQVPGVTILSDPEGTVAVVVAPTVEEAKPEEVAPAAEAEPEVITKGKAEEGAEAEGESK